jgi:VWFA-related protein
MNLGARTIASVSLVSLAVAIAGADDRQRFTSRTDAVRVDVLVTDGRRHVASLTAGDFEIRDNGVLQKIALVQTEQLPIDLLFALDTSRSVAGRLLKDLTDAGSAAVEAMRDRDRVALLSFASRVRLLSPWTSNGGAVREALAAMSASGRTALRDGAFHAVALREPGDRRTVILLFSDGRDTASWLTGRRSIEAASRADVVVYPVVVQRWPPGRENSEFLERLAEETGGRVVVAKSNSDLRATFTGILSEFRDRYVLTYQPDRVAGAGWHRIDVRLKGKNGRVTARRGYFVE